MIASLHCISMVPLSLGQESDYRNMPLRGSAKPSRVVSSIPSIDLDVRVQQYSHNAFVPALRCPYKSRPPVILVSYVDFDIALIQQDPNHVFVPVSCSIRQCRVAKEIRCVYFDLVLLLNEQFHYFFLLPVLRG